MPFELSSHLHISNDLLFLTSYSMIMILGFSRAFQISVHSFPFFSTPLSSLQIFIFPLALFPLGLVLFFYWFVKIFWLVFATLFLACLLQLPISKNHQHIFLLRIQMFLGFITFAHVNTSFVTFIWGFLRLMSIWVSAEYKTSMKNVMPPFLCDFIVQLFQIKSEW